MAGNVRGRRRQDPWGQCTRTRNLESDQERAERARRIQDFLRRGGRIKRYPLAVAAGAGLVQVGGWAASAERTADLLVMGADLASA
jgi:hypothetical protein